jgi:hypothetical protein
MTEKSVPTHPYFSRPHFIREGSQFIIEMPDGSLIPLDAMQASLLAQEIVACLAGAYVAAVPHADFFVRQDGKEASEPHQSPASQSLDHHPQRIA